MIIVGAKGFAKELLEILHQNNQLEDLAFYDDINLTDSNLLFGKFPILRNEYQIHKHFKQFGNEFTLGIGKPKLRKYLHDKFVQLGGTNTSVMSKNSDIGSYDVKIGDGCNILSGAIISNSVSLGLANIIYYNSVITHDVITGNFVEVSPGVKLLGNCLIGDFTSIGTNATILPNIKIGKNSIIGAGSVVTKDIPDNSIAFGIPAKIIKINND